MYVAELEEACDQGVEVACDNLNREQEAKRAWLAQADQHWGRASRGVQSEEAAKQAWLKRIEAPTWGKARDTFSSVAAEAAYMAQLEEACDQGVEVACDNLSREEEAKRAWLASLDVPTWGPGAAALSQVNDVAVVLSQSEEVAKQAWLANADERWGSSTWGRQPVMSEEAAKRAWLARLDAPTWGKAATALASVANEAAYMAEMEEACDQGVEVACESLSREEEAKRAWMAARELPSWGPKPGLSPPRGAAPVTHQQPVTQMPDIMSDLSAGYDGSVRPSHTPEEMAKQAWLQKQEAWRSTKAKWGRDVAMLAVGGQEPLYIEDAPPHAMLGVGGQGLAPPQAQTTRGSVASSRAPPMPDSTILVQGGSLRTWSYRSPAVEQVQVILGTEGRPLDADIELWHGPDNTPVKMRVYVENGQIRPFSAVIETPRGPNTVAIRNIGQIEFPIAANVIADDVDLPSPECAATSMTIQGGALRTYPFDPSVDSVEVLIKTDGRPLNARIELLQGPNNNKQVIELYTEDGCDRPFFCILETPGSGNVVRIVNTSPVEFPMAASVVPHMINQEMSSNVVLGGDVVIGGDVGW
jgi:hypothetical protein